MSFIVSSYRGLVRGVCILTLIATVLEASGEKRSLKRDMTLEYHLLPGEVNSLEEMFSQGVWYGRFRVNSFRWDWKDDKKKDNWAIGVGGSLEYKTAYLKGIGATLAFYTSQNPWHMDEEEIKFIKAGKDTFSRYKVATGGGFGMDVVAQAYLEYKKNNLSFKAGRQIVETILIKSNDTKMIPNTFEGYSLTATSSLNSFKLAYLTSQKLRDHISFHDPLTFGKDLNQDGVIEGIEKWANNDDSAVNKTLNEVNFKKVGKDSDHSLIVMETATTFFPHTRLIFNYTTVPDVVGLGVIEGHHKFNLNNFNIIPGFRYIKQFDQGAKEIGRIGVAIANLKGKGEGYKNPYSVEGALWMGRVDIKPKNRFWWLRIGYSAVADKADIIAPWRGFPTKGFTRAMGQYNWYANTKTYLVRLFTNWDNMGVSNGLKTSLRYVIQNFDDKKSGVQADSKVVHFDVIKKMRSGVYFKFRLGIVDGDNSTYDIQGKLKPDPSYNEYRIELNYLF